jgi:SAM-dependent MidA family methyltransferase
MPLLNVLLERIGRSGPITFRDFMDVALYDSEAGYYGSGRARFGNRGDFVTASGVHYLFGELLARWILQRWSDLDEPSEYTIVEIGPGSGRLACDILDALDAHRGRVPSRLTYALVERGAALRDRQRALLRRHGQRVVWSRLDAFAPQSLTGVILANELFDALPVHRARLGCRRIEEQWVTVGVPGPKLVSTWSEPSTPHLAAYVERYAPGMVDDDHSIEIEVCLDAPALLARAAQLLARGHLLIVDYGDEANRLYGVERPRGTIRAFAGRHLLDNVLAEPGHRDITANVNFTALAAAGRALGLEADPLVSQRRFLLDLGLAERVGALVAAGDSPAAVESRLAAKALLLPGGIGDAMKVLVQRTCSTTG